MYFWAFTWKSNFIVSCMQLDMCWWCILRMKRYCDPKYKNKVTASKDVLQLYATEEGRNLFGIYLWHCCLPMFFYIHHMFAPVTEVRSYGALLEKHGDFKDVELEVSRWNRVTNKLGQKGRWVTKSYLMEVEKYRRTAYSMLCHHMLSRLFQHMQWSLI